MDHQRLERLGITPAYTDNLGNHHRVDEETVAGLLAAMGLPEDAQDLPVTDDLLVVRAGESHRVASGELELEDGSSRRVDTILPTDLPLGYHTLHPHRGEPRTVIVSPGRCAAHPGRTWGWAVQLYSTLSASSWGVGDLADLRDLGRWSAEQGAGINLINPLDAVIPQRPRQNSPYFPSSRRFRDVLYLRIEEVPGSEVAADELASLAGRARTDGERIDRDAVTDAKLAALEHVWRHAPDAGHEPGFIRYQAEQGEALATFATYMALAERHGCGWRSWPAEHRHPGSPGVATTAAERADRVSFHAWVQWLLDEQLEAAARPLALMRDLPVGFDPDGADAWAWQDLLATGVTIGAPPDELGPHGQDWMMPPLVPWKLRAAHYAPFIETVRSAMRHAGALRIDHVMGLFRLFWIPSGDASRGTYIRQHTEELLDILALESHRAGAYVVGEDLGTVEPGVREELTERRMLRYRVLWFEEEPPQQWHPRGLGSITT
ncbi:MAG: 4-alpha-glucanotransferase, partial [Actinomycetota bacterium]